MAYAEQQTAMEYGVPSFVVADVVWDKNHSSASAFSVGGQVYFRETLPEELKGMFAPHEITHVMKQVGFAPYLDFIDRTPDMLNMSVEATHRILEGMAERPYGELKQVKAHSKAQL